LQEGQKVEFITQFSDKPGKEDKLEAKDVTVIG